VDSLGGKGKQLEVNNFPHVTMAFESDCDTVKWNIARINHKSNARCHAQQHESKIRCTAKISKGKKRIHVPIGRKIVGISQRWWRISSSMQMTLNDA